MDKQPEEQKTNKLAAFLRRIFVHNFGWKVLSVVSAGVIWFLISGLW